MKFAAVMAPCLVLALAPLCAADSALFGSGFEDGSWIFQDASMSRRLPESARAGGFGLRVVDDSGSAGSSVASPRLPVVPGTGYRLSFWARTVSGGGAGVYLRFFASGGEKPLATASLDIPASRTEWRQYDLTAVAPENSAAVDVWIHSYALARVSFDLDDVSLSSFAVEVKPPWEPAYKLSPQDQARLTPADVVGPDGLVYPDWRMAGVPGGIPDFPVVVPADAFRGLEEQDISAALEKAISRASAQGGGAVALPPGTFYLDHPVIIRSSGVVVRGAGRDRTTLVSRDRIPGGQVRFFNWSGTAGRIGPGTAFEIQANPRNLASLRLETPRGVVRELLRSADEKGWGNRFALRVSGDDLLARLGPGEYDFTAVATYKNGGHFSSSLRVLISPEPLAPASPDQHGIVVFVGPGKQGAEILLTQDGLRGSRSLRVVSGHGLRPGDRIIVESPATERWNRLVGNTVRASHFRQYLYEITAVDDGLLTLNQPLRMEFPVVDGSFVQKAAFVERSGIEELTIVQQPVPSDPAEPRPVSLRYWYPIEDLWLDGVTSSYAWACWVRGVRVVTAGRNPIFLTRSKFCEVRDCVAEEALFKGSGGTGYVGFERSFDCLMDSVSTRNMRHAPILQWGAAGNVIRNGRFVGSDAQWHAGWTNENLLEGNIISSTSADMAGNNSYGYGLFSTGPSDPLHGPEGPRNVVYRNDISSPKDGLRMMGGNEAWIVAYNRFRIEEGFAVYGREKTFDHIIRGNVFLIRKVPAFAVQFDSPECTGIELIGNAFYGPVTRLSGFLNDLGRIAREEDNTVLPYSDDAPMPAPPVPSIFEWQRRPSLSHNQNPE